MKYIVSLRSSFISTFLTRFLNVLIDRGFLMFPDGLDHITGRRVAWSFFQVRTSTYDLET